MVGSVFFRDLITRFHDVEDSHRQFPEEEK